MSKMPSKEPVSKVVVDEKGSTVLLPTPVKLVYVKLSTQPICKYIIRYEREQLLIGLKQNW